jgi:hypothetical protein
MEIPPEILAQLRVKVWMPFKFRKFLRERREWKTGRRERRGRPTEYDDEALICIYVEIEAHARLKTRGKIFSLLALGNARLFEGKTSRRLNRLDRQLIRRQHQMGKREALQWKITLFMGRPHPKWSEIQRRIEKRMAELRVSPDRLFFLKLV